MDCEGFTMAAWYQDLRNTHKDKIFDALKSDETSRVTFSDELKVLNNSDAVFDTFIAHTTPFRENGSRVKEYAQWVCKHYLEGIEEGKPILTEDFFKVKRDIDFLRDEKNSQRLKGHDAQLNHYSFKTLRTWYIKRQDDLRLERILSGDEQDLSLDQDRLDSVPESIFAETEIIKDDKFGLAISPKTYRASRYWGKETEWCTTQQEKHFDNYNSKSPLVYFTPRGSKQWFGIHEDNTVKDSNDEELNNLTPEVSKMMEGLLEYLHPIDRLRLAPSNKDYALKAIHKKMMPYDQTTPAYYYLSDELLEDRAVLEAIFETSRDKDDFKSKIGRYSAALYFAPKASNQFKAVSLVKEAPSILSHLPESMHTNEAVLEAVFSSSELGDVDFAKLPPESISAFFTTDARAIRLIEEMPHVRRYIPDDLQKKPSVAVATAMHISGPELSKFLRIEVDREADHYPKVALAAFASASKPKDVLSAIGDDFAHDRKFIISGLIANPELHSQIDSSFDQDKLIAILTVLYSADMNESFEDFFEDRDFHIAMLNSKKPLDDYSYEEFCDDNNCDRISLDDLDDEDTDLVEAFKEFQSNNQDVGFIDLLENPDISSKEIISIPKVSGVRMHL